MVNGGAQSKLDIRLEAMELQSLQISNAIESLKTATTERMQELESAYHESVRFTENRLVALAEKFDILVGRIPLQCSEPDPTMARTMPMKCSELVQFVDSPLVRTDTSELQVSL